ncbi:complement C1q-like protein 2 [Mya arenaria]|uniref:complement C1q-like protein 2 n=1 Tax=Mya arenaria TaxID=6604 RepID=UPI0022DF9550|nr:complement C1q-like protein 2 [Mya arenaria]
MKGVFLFLFLNCIQHSLTSNITNGNASHTGDAFERIDGGLLKSVFDRLSHLEEKVIRLEDDNSMLKKTLANLVMPPEDSGSASAFVPESTAFYAYMSATVNNINAHEIILFDVEVTDTMSNYNPKDGMFTASVGGVYVFTITIHSFTNSFINAEIIVNGDVKGVANADSEEISDIHSSSATCVVQMAAGEHAFVRRGINSRSVIVSVDGWGRSTFSGWLLN